MQKPADLRQVMKKMSRWSNPTRRRNRIPAEIILITSGRVVGGDERPPL